MSFNITRNPDKDTWNFDEFPTDYLFDLNDPQETILHEYLFTPNEAQMNLNFSQAPPQYPIQNNCSTSFQGTSVTNSIPTHLTARNLEHSLQSPQTSLQAFNIPSYPFQQNSRPRQPAIYSSTSTNSPHENVHRGVKRKPLENPDEVMSYKLTKNAELDVALQKKITLHNQLIDQKIACLRVLDRIKILASGLFGENKIFIELFLPYLGAYNPEKYTVLDEQLHCLYKNLQSCTDTISLSFLERQKKSNSKYSYRYDIEKIDIITLNLEVVLLNDKIKRISNLYEKTRETFETLKTEFINIKNN